ncbi:GNAT family N-acetyltransferase [Streptomyces sp. RFCAC02]|uniref:GNAT family N-acetyltransferase n=1 Tax=Streptomyces sp. RFCAC02 TaxID=2499143 RepID=UPI00101F21F1|nr:GNAT family N-acetyltransferase [Streptomyces sp. RFCAC02]
MGRRLVPLTPDCVGDLPARCRDCLFWEAGPVGEPRRESGSLSAEGPADGLRRKRAWVSSLTQEWGPCGRLVVVDETRVGFALYAPPDRVPRAAAFPTSPVSPDAVLLLTAWLAPECRGQGLGRTLMQSVVKDLAGRGVRAIECFADARGRTDSCLLPAPFLAAVGFEEARSHRVSPRMRLELRRTVSWRTDVGQAWDRLVGSGRGRVSLQPALRAGHVSRET